MTIRQTPFKPVIEVARLNEAPWAAHLNGCDPVGHVYRVQLPYGNQVVGYVHGPRELALRTARGVLSRTSYGSKTLTQKHKSRAMTVNTVRGNPGRPSTKAADDEDMEAEEDVAA